MLLKQLQCLLYKVPHVRIEFLTIIDLVTKVLIPVLQEIHHWKDLSVVGHEGLSQDVTGLHQVLKVSQSFDNYLCLFGAQGLLNGDDQLREDW